MSWSSSLWLLVGTFFSHPTCARFHMGGAHPALCGCDCICFWYTYAVCESINDLRFMWLLVCCLYRRLIYKVLNVRPFDYTAVAGSGKVGSVIQVNHTSWGTVVTPTDSPKSVRNRCVIELFGGVFVFLCCLFPIPVDTGTFVIRLSQIVSFKSHYIILNIKMYVSNSVFPFAIRVTFYECHLIIQNNFSFDILRMCPAIKIMST